MYDFSTTPDAATTAMALGSIMVASFIGLIAYAAIAIGLWKVFIKAGHEGWKAIVPVYNFYILIQIAERPTWYLYLVLGSVVVSIIPVVGWILSIPLSIVCLVISILVNLDIAKRFGKETVFAVGMILLTPIFYLILGFDDSKYTPLNSPAEESNKDYSSF